MVPGPLTGPHLVDEVPAAALAALWIAVTRAGGAVGFPADAPESEIVAAARAAAERVRGRREHLLVVRGRTPADLAGTAFLHRNAGPRVEHGAEVVRLMVHPEQQGRG